MTTPLAPLIIKPKPQPPPVAFVRLEELPRGEAVTALVYGGPKTGKRWFLGTAGSRTLFIDTGRGVETLKSPMFKQVVKANPIIVQIDEKIGSRGVPELADAFNTVCDTIDYALEHFSSDFDTICVDELTSLRRFAMYRGLEYNQQTRKSTTWSKMSEHDMIVPAIQDYGAEMSLIEQFCNSYTLIAKNSGKHFLLAAHQRYLLEKPRNKDGDILIGEPQVVKEIRPAVTGAQFPDVITALFDNVWRTEKASGGEHTVYRLRVHGDEQIVAGTRHAGVFPTIIRKPNFLTMLEYIRSGVPMKDLESPKPQPKKEEAQ